MLKREKYIKLWKELSSSKSMVFLSGPRQSGKTTLSKIISREFENKLYFNYDDPFNKKTIIEDPFFFEKINRKNNSKPLIIYDEIHKYKDWKNYLKSVYDKYSKEFDFLILGSRRLNTFQKGGDSLAGRYFLFSLFPLTLSELMNINNDIDKFLLNPLNIEIEENNYYYEIWEKLNNNSGFPEPYLENKKKFYNRWSRLYNQQLIKEDIRNMTEVKKIDDIEILFSLLPSKVGSPLSMDSLSRDIKVSFNSIKNWLSIFQSFYLCFSIKPYTKKISRAISKEKKYYLYNYSSITSKAERFENMIAIELYSLINYLNDYGYGDFSLNYVRNKQKEEIDFLISEKDSPILMIEVKYNNENISKNLIKFQNILGITAIQLVNKKGIYKKTFNNTNKILIISAPRWLAMLP